MSAEDMKELVLKGACAEKDASENRRFKIAEILKEVEYASNKERDHMLKSFVKSSMSLEEIEKFATWRMERDAGTETINDLAKELGRPARRPGPIGAGVQ